MRPPQILLVAAAALGLTLSAAPAATAGDYTVSYCKDENGANRSLVDWVQNNNRGFTSDSATNGCADGNDVMTLDWTTHASRPAGSRTGWRLVAKNDNRIVGWSAQASAALPSSDTAVDLTGVASCRTWEGCVERAFGGSASMDTPAVEFVLVCAANGGNPCTGTASARLWGNAVTFRDPVAPTAFGTPSGTLLSSSPGNPLSGAVEVAAGAADTGSGIRHLTLEVDGQDVAKTLDLCQPPYDRQQPCPLQTTGTMRLDTTRVADGTHNAKIVGVDASGGRGILWGGQIIIGNDPTRGPGSDINVRGAANGQNASDDATLATWWPSTGRAPSRSKTVRRSCRRSKSYRRRYPVRCNGRSPRGVITTAFSSKRTATIAGRLQTAAGQPIAGATVELVRVPRATGIAPQSLGTITTDADGRWKASVPVAAGSATIAARYRARVRDTVTRDGQSILRVKAATTLRVPKRGRRGRSITFRGNLRGTAGQRQGVAIPLQVYYRGRWRTFATPVTGTDGAWSYRYRFSRKAASRYRFRAHVTPNAVYPYAAGRSTVRTVRVR